MAKRTIEEQFQDNLEDIFVDGLGFDENDTPSMEDPNTWEFSDEEEAQFEALRNLVDEINAEEGYSAEIIQNNGELSLQLKRQNIQILIPFKYGIQDFTEFDSGRNSFFTDPGPKKTGWVRFNSLAFTDSPAAEEAFSKFVKSTSRAQLGFVKADDYTRERAKFDLTNPEDLEEVKRSLIRELANQAIIELKVRAEQRRLSK